MSTRSVQSGFTVMEMMIVVLIIGILSAMAVPSMRDLIRTQRVKTASFDVYAGLILARSEAIKRNMAVTLTPGGGDWAAGWTATDAGGTVVAKQGALSNITVAGPATVTFSGMGRANAIAAFSITAPDIPTTSYRCVKLDLSGRPVSSVGACT